MEKNDVLDYTGERIVPGADSCEPNFASRMYQEHIVRYLFAAQLVVGKAVLDVGCGVGYGSQYLAQTGAASVRAFDLSQDAIAHARLHYAHENVSFDVGNAETFDFESQFDVVTCFELIEHVNNPERVLDNIRRALKPNGILVISTPRALEEKRTHFHTHEFGFSEFDLLLKKNFGSTDFYVENNHFSSIVTKGMPKRLDRILCLKDQFGPEKADVFIVLASPAEGLEFPPMNPSLSVDDDAYVTMLEQDATILHKAEDDLKSKVAFVERHSQDQERYYLAEIERITSEYNEQFKRLEETSAELWHVNNANAELTAKVSELDRDDHQSRAQNTEVSGNLGDVSMQSVDMGIDQATIRETLKALTVRVNDAEARRHEAYDFARITSDDALGVRRELEALKRDIALALDAPQEKSEQHSDPRYRDIVESMERLFLGTAATHTIARSPLVDRINDLWSKLEQQSERADQAERVAAGKDAELAAAWETEKSLDAQLATQREKEQALTAELAVQRERAERAETFALDWHEQLLTIRKSVAWRMTKPFRGLARSFRK